MKEANWSNLAAFLQAVMSMEVPEAGIVLFRGQSVAAPLLPKLVRGAPLTDVTAVEKKMLLELKRQGSLVGEVNQPSDLELLAVAQHYGMATRLLDWSTNPLVALWFACTGQRPEQSAHIYVYRVYPENIESEGSGIDPFKLAMTRVFRPSLNSNRLAAQGGWFSIHPCMGGSFGYKPLDQDPLHFLSIYHFEIPAAEKRKVLHAIDLLGINARTLFPGIGGLAEHMNWAFLSELPGLR